MCFQTEIELCLVNSRLIQSCNRLSSKLEIMHDTYSFDVYNMNCHAASYEKYLL